MIPKSSKSSKSRCGHLWFIVLKESRKSSKSGKSRFRHLLITGELEEDSAISILETVQNEGSRKIKRKMIIKKGLNHD